MKLGIYSEDLSIVVCSNNDSWLTLTYFNPNPNLVTEAFAWKKVKIVCFFISEPITA